MQVIVHHTGVVHRRRESSETPDQATADLLEDTPTCRDAVRFPRDCPDAFNLMFPIEGFQAEALSEDQTFVLGAHPLFKAAR